jgi:methionyl-tRNA formyltransferase
VDGEIDWAQPSRRIYNLIRALTFPYPGAYTYYRGQRIFVLRAEEIDRPCYRGRIPGRVVQILPGQGVDVLTADGVLRVTHVSSDGRTTRSAEDVIRSVKMSLGLRLQDLEERLAEMERRLEALTPHATR